MKIDFQFNAETKIGWTGTDNDFSGAIHRNFTEIGREVWSIRDDNPKMFDRKPLQFIGVSSSMFDKKVVPDNPNTATAQLIDGKLFR